MNTSHLIVLMADTAAPTPIVSDTFTRANSASSLGTTDTSQTWISARGTWGITSNQANNTVNDPSSRNVAVVESGVADGAVEVVIANSEGFNEGVTFRYVDVDNWLAVGTIWGVNLRAINLYKRVSGVNSTVLLATGTTGTTPRTLRVEFVGTSLVVKISGVQKATATVTEFTTATKHGLFTDANLAALITTWDNFTVNSI